jgi:HEAT repeat protein
LARSEETEELLLEHLHDANWAFLLDCYAGLGRAGALVKALLKESRGQGQRESLLRAARWAALAPEEAKWRNLVLQALAQAFVDVEVDEAFRLEIGRALALVAGESALPFYLQALRHPAPVVRTTALRGLGWTGSPREVQVLTAALNHQSFDARANAVRALGDLGTPGAMRVLSDYLQHSEEELLMVVAEALASNQNGWDILREMAEAPDLLMRRSATRGLGQINEPWAEKQLEYMMIEDPQWLVRSAAEAALALRREHVTGTAVPAPPQVDEAHWLLRWAADQGLGVGAGDAALPMLMRSLEVGDREIRILAARTLSLVGRQEHLESLKSLLAKSERADVRKALAEAVRDIQRRYQGLPTEETWTYG